ncbi:hypothetical protein OF83DRAFT_1110248 [Amylostereum chailletii]|nr:hypothetical protein OF83DRAFT_1110248 [Amylostereum chailletii]
MSGSSGSHSRSSEDLLLEERDRSGPGFTSGPPSPPPEQDNEEWGTHRARSSDDGFVSHFKRPWARITHRYPNLGLRARRLAEFIQGSPPSAEDLREPAPWLFVPYKMGPRPQRVPLESLFMYKTRFLTSPFLFIIFVVIYLLTIASISRAQSFQTPRDAFIGCSNTFWPAQDRCGLDGQNCLPFDNASFSFRCESACSTVFLHNPRTIGNQEMVYEPLIVGGGDEERTYRGDSFICAAALHAGIISDSRGGCVKATLAGTHTNFLPRKDHGLNSMGFPSEFPLSFRLSSTAEIASCTDLRNDALVFNAFVTAFLFMVLRPKPLILYWSLVCIGYWHVTLFSQPRGNPPDLSFAFGTFLPAMAFAYVFWRAAFRFVLPSFATKLPIEGGLLYLGPYWITVLNNMTLDRLPVDRLIMNDILARPGGLATLIAIVVLLAGIVVNQVVVIRKMGYLVQYLGYYLAGICVVAILALLPGLNLRIHHYILAIILIPGTAFPTRLSAVYQGFLLGLFLNGVAAWGFDSILQTSEELRRDAPMGSSLPIFVTNSTTYDPSVLLHNQSLGWLPIPSTEDWDGFALLVDDVERYVGPALNYSMKALQEGIPHFFRIAFTRAGSTGDFTMPATLWPNGTWVDPLPGASY